MEAWTMNGSRKAATTEERGMRERENRKSIMTI